MVCQTQQTKRSSKQSRLRVTPCNSKQVALLYTSIIGGVFFGSSDSCFLSLLELEEKKIFDSVMLLAPDVRFVLQASVSEIFRFFLEGVSLAAWSRS